MFLFWAKLFRKRRAPKYSKWVIASPFLYWFTSELVPCIPTVIGVKVFSVPTLNLWRCSSYETTLSIVPKEKVKSYAIQLKETFDQNELIKSKFWPLILFSLNFKCENFSNTFILTLKTCQKFPFG